MLKEKSFKLKTGGPWTMAFYALAFALIYHEKGFKAGDQYHRKRVLLPWLHCRLIVVWHCRNWKLETKTKSWASSIATQSERLYRLPLHSYAHSPRIKNSIPAFPIYYAESQSTQGNDVQSTNEKRGYT